MPSPQNIHEPLHATLSAWPDDLTIASRIIQGLLASGHYTSPVGSYGTDDPEVRYIDHGENWQSYKHQRRYQHKAVIDALELFYELKSTIKEYGDHE